MGFALRLYNLAHQSLWYDELLQLDIAQGNPPGQGGIDSIFPRLRGHAAVPLDYLIAYFWIQLGHSEGWVRLPAVIFGTLALPIAFQMGQKLLGQFDGLLLMSLLALSPFHLRYSQEARPYALVVVGACLTIYAYWQLGQTSRRRYILLLQVGVFILVLAHFFAVALLIPLLALSGLEIILKRNRPQIIKATSLLLVTLILPMAVLLFSGWGGLFYTLKGFGEALVELDKFTAAPEQKLDKGEGPQLTLSFFKFEMLTPLSGARTDTGLWLFNGLAGLGLLYLLAQRRYQVGLFLLLWLITPVILILTFLIYRGAFFASRYIIFTLPAYLSLVTLGLLALPRWLSCAQPPWLSRMALLILAGAILFNLSGALDKYFQAKNKENWRLVGEFIAHNVQPGDAVIAMRAEPAVNWYYPQAWAGPNYYWDLAEIKESAATARRSWVILSIYSAPVDGPVKLWLQEQGAVHFQLDPAIVLYYLGLDVPPDQLLAEAQHFALPQDHALYASLAQQNRSRPTVARQYYQLAVQYAPDETIKAQYQTELNTLGIETQ